MANSRCSTGGLHSRNVLAKNGGVIMSDESREVTVRSDWTPGTYDNQGQPVVADDTTAPSNQSSYTFEGREYKSWNFDNTGRPKDELAKVDLMIAGPENAAALIGLDPDMVARWSKEGGVAENLKAAKATSQRIDAVLGESADAISALANGLPDSLRNKMIDAMRLSPGRGSIESQIRAFEDRLSDDEFSRWSEFTDNLTKEQARAIKKALIRK